MPINEPTPPEKIFTDEFAKSGEVEKVPNDLSGDEKLSWLGGFTRRFSRIPAKENGLNMIRQTFAGIVQPISAKIIQAENDLRTRFFKTDGAKIENSDISYLETPQLTAQNLNAQTGKITDFSHELIKPKEKTIITDLTQNAGVIKSVDSLSIVDKAGSVNIILSPNTSKSVLNNTPPDEAEGKELINAEWVHSNYGTAPSPYIHTFTGTSTTIPYEKIRGLKWVKFIFGYSISNQGVFSVKSGSSCYYFCPSIGKCFYTCYSQYDTPDKFYYQKINFEKFTSSDGYAPPRDTVCIYCHGCSQVKYDDDADIVKISYSIKTGELKILLNKDYKGATYSGGNCVTMYPYFNNNYIKFSKDGKD